MIKFRKGYKYQLAEDYVREIDIHEFDISIEFISLTKDGVLTIKSGFSFDGPSGPTIDTDNFMEGSLVHDVLYFLMRQSLLPLSYKEYADKLLKEICIEKGMCKIRAGWVYLGVKIGGKGSTLPKNKKEVYVIK